MTTESRPLYQRPMMWIGVALAVLLCGGIGVGVGIVRLSNHSTDGNGSASAQSLADDESEAGEQVWEPCDPLPEGWQDTKLAFGETFTWPDGVSVSVSNLTLITDRKRLYDDKVNKSYESWLLFRNNVTVTNGSEHVVTIPSRDYLIDGERDTDRYYGFSEMPTSNRDLQIIAGVRWASTGLTDSKGFADMDPGEQRTLVSGYSWNNDWGFRGESTPISETDQLIDGFSYELGRCGKTGIVSFSSSESNRIGEDSSASVEANSPNDSSEYSQTTVDVGVGAVSCNSVTIPDAPCLYPPVTAPADRVLRMREPAALGGITLTPMTRADDFVFVAICSTSYEGSYSVAPWYIHRQGAGDLEPIGASGTLEERKAVGYGGANYIRPGECFTGPITVDNTDNIDMLRYDNGDDPIVEWDISVNTNHCPELACE